MGGMDSHDGGDVEERWKAIRAGVANLAKPAAPPPTPTPSRPWRRTRRAVALVAVVAAFSVLSFVAGWITGLGGLDALPPSTTVAHEPQPVSAPTSPDETQAAPTAAEPVAEASETYTYVVESNHPVRLAYVDSAGENVHLDSIDAPWRTTVDTAEWGADTRPSLMVFGAEHGDTFVSCTVTDANGQVVAGDRKETADPAVFCRRR